MPELPEVETTLSAISPIFTGNIVKKVEINNANLRWKVPVDLAEKISQSPIIKCWRRGKYIILENKFGACLLHLGMSGKLSINANNSNLKKHDHVVFKLQNYQVHLNDPRRFGCVLWADKPILSYKLLCNLGPEPLSSDFDHEFLYNATRLKKALIKNWLMNANNVVGVGNIYANEALFYSKVSPLRQVQDLSLLDCQHLVYNIKKILEKSIKLGGTTLRDFYSPDAKSGYFQQKLAVYAKEGEDCIICGSKIISIKIGQRSSFYCNVCQN